MIWFVITYGRFYMINQAAHFSTSKWTNFNKEFMSNFFREEIPISFFTARKTIISFFKCYENIVFPKESRWNMIFLVLSGKMMFLFPENVILFFRWEMKDDLSQKNTWKYDIFFECPEKMVFPKKGAIRCLVYTQRLHY